MCDTAGAKNGFSESDKSFVSVEQSDDDAEIWARTVDLPGFDDNVSPNNYITVLLRFVIGMHQNSMFLCGTPLDTLLYHMFRTS